MPEEKKLKREERERERVNYGLEARETTKHNIFSFQLVLSSKQIDFLVEVSFGETDC